MWRVYVVQYLHAYIYNTLSYVIASVKRRLKTGLGWRSNNPSFYVHILHVYTITIQISMFVYTMPTSLFYC